MQKCLGEILNEENEYQPINKVMADKDVKNDNRLINTPEPISDDIGKYLLKIIFMFNYYKYMRSFI